MTCPECQPLYDGWLNYKAPYTRWVQYESGAARSVESYHQKAKERRDLVRRQLALIVENCRRKHC